VERSVSPLVLGPVSAQLDNTLSDPDKAGLDVISGWSIIGAHANVGPGRRLGRLVGLGVVVIIGPFAQA
jgi:hypothetical protein